MRIYSRILGTGSYLPDKRLTNADLAAELAQQGVETSDDWIVERTGIRARHFAADEQGCSDLATEAARQALSAAGVAAQDIDLIIVATSTPEMVFPSVATMVQHKLGDPVLKMDGQAVFKLAVGVLDETARASLAKANLTEADIDWLIPHQANIRIMQSTARKLKLGADKVVVTVDQHGNTSAASIPLALDTAVRDGRIQRGQTLMLEGVGGGFTWGSVLLRY